MKKPVKRRKGERIASRRGGTRKLEWPQWVTVAQVLGLWLVLMLVFFFSGGRSTQLTNWAAGQQAPETVTAAVDFIFENMQETRLRRNQAAETVPPAFAVESRRADEAERGLDKIFARLIQLRDAGPDRREAARSSFENYLDAMSLALMPEEVEELVRRSDAAALQEALKKAVREILGRGVVSEESRITGFKGLAPGSEITVYGRAGAGGERVAIAGLLTEAEAVAAVLEVVQDEGSGGLKKIVARWMTSNLAYDPARTALLKREAAASVEPVIETVLAGATIIEARESVTAQDLVKLQAHFIRLSELETPWSRALRTTGNGVLLMAALMIATAFFRILHPLRDFKNRWIFLLVLLALLVLPLDKLLLYGATQRNWFSSSIVEYLLPHALVPLLATILLSAGIGMIAGLGVSLAAAILFSGSFSVCMLGLLVTAVTVHRTREVKKRSALFQAALWISLAKVLFVLTQAVLNQPALQVIAQQAGAAVVSAFVSCMAALLLIPVLESLFGITTDIRLIELSDMGHPLLQRLALEAPGTYHHSLMVASLSQAAAERIGANPLLVRVCAYFHDIGKLVKPAFFTENIQYRENPHDDLAPSMSTLVIMSHIKEGVELARRNRLPEPVQDAIRQHHGTGLISYFYHRAKTLNPDEEKEISDADFRYPGPRPVSAEMAILCLADAVEAASRSIEKATPARIAALVEEIVQGKMKDRQLEQSPITMAQLAEIKESFIFTLTNMLHGRVAYPKDENNRTKPAGAASAESAENPKADRSA